MAAIGEFTVKNVAEVRDDILRTYRNGLIARGVSDPNVSPGSDIYVIATSIAQEIVVLYANLQIRADGQMPDTATGDDLTRIGEIVGLNRRSAGGSSGFIVFDASAASLVVTGSELIDGAGLRYSVTAGGTYSDGELIPVSAIDVGKVTNLAVGDSLRWQAAPAYSAPIALVATLGLTDGTDDEDDETYRTRVLAAFRTPAGGGNWSHVAQLSEESSPTVQKAFVYPALQGPATCHVAIAGAPSTSSKDRTVSVTIVDNLIKPTVIGNLPEHAQFTFTTVTNVNTDVSIALTLPAATSASPSGPGGGWLDGQPWPYNSASSATFKCAVTGVTNTTQFTVDAPATPTANVSRIAWLSPSDWKLYIAKVIAVSGSAGAYVITIDNPFIGIATGSYIWPQCANQQIYADAFINAMGLMGPGEKTADVVILQRAYRHPLTSTAWPSALNATILKSVSNAGSEVLDVAYYYRSTTAPAIPGAVTDPPNILIPRHIGFYPAV